MEKNVDDVLFYLKQNITPNERIELDEYLEVFNLWDKLTLSNLIYMLREWKHLPFHKKVLDYLKTHSIFDSIDEDVLKFRCMVSNDKGEEEVQFILYSLSGCLYLPTEGDYSKAVNSFLYSNIFKVSPIIKYVSQYEYNNHISGFEKPPMDIFDVLTSSLVWYCSKSEISDLHFDTIQTGGIEYTIKGRKKKELVLLKEVTKEFYEALIIWLLNASMSPSTDIAQIEGIETTVPNILPGIGAILRLSGMVVTTKNGNDSYCVVCRIQYKKTQSMTLNTLGLNSTFIKECYLMCKKHSGLFVMGGTTNTGKSSTIGAIVKEVLTKPRKLYYFTHPVEEFPGCVMIDYKGNNEILKNCVRLSKKQDPDTVILNEIPSKEIASSVVDLVNSGVFVLTTMHYNRLRDLPFKYFEYFGDNFIDMLKRSEMLASQIMITRYEDDIEKNIVFADNTIYSKILYDYLGSYTINVPIKEVEQRLQPVVEWLVVDDEFRSKLDTMTNPQEVSMLIESLLKEKGQNFEKSLCDGVAKGIYPINSLNYIL